MTPPSNMNDEEIINEATFLEHSLDVHPQHSLDVLNSMTARFIELKDRHDNVVKAAVALLENIEK